MAGWVARPIIYEINTWVWLNTLSRIHQQPLRLDSVPDAALDELAALNIDAVWLMGVWQRSPAARQSALNYTHEYRPVLPDLTDDDVIGSAYAIGAYEVDERLGGRHGLARLRQRLQDRGIKLILDFVPNHVAADHPWISSRPVYFVRANHREFKRHRSKFFAAQDAWGRALYVAHGRDPYFPGWIDTAQLNAFSPAYRQAATDTLLDIASQCDGVRCDMAMLMLNSVFANTWGDYLEEELPETDFWQEIIPHVKAQHPGFAFIAEVYWGLEGVLLQQGFDWTYDKTLYDRIGEGDVQKIRDHLRAPLTYQKRTVRFIENHDEPRAMTSFGLEKSRAAAALLCTLPGAVLLHDGQLAGRKIKLPVQIKRQPDEPIDESLRAFYGQLLSEARSAIYQTGEWRLFDVQPSFQGNDTNANLLACGWQDGAERRLIVVNLTGAWSHGIVKLGAWDGVSSSDWCLHDVLADVYYYRPAHQINGGGLYVELKPYTAQVFRFERIEEGRTMEYPCQLFTQAH